MAHNNIGTVNLTKKRLSSNINYAVIAPPRVAIPITPAGAAVISTADSKFGGSSLKLTRATSDYIRVGYSTTLSFTGDFTIEMWVKFTSSEASTTIWTDSTAITWQLSGGALVWYEGSNKSFGAVSNGTWYHVAVSRSAGTIKGFLDGVEKFSYTSSTTINVSGSQFGRRSFSPVGYYFEGYMDEIRVSNVCRYTAGFTPATAAFTDDLSTVFLFHADGTDNQTLMYDDGPVRTNALTVTSVGSPTIATDVKKYGDGSILLNGTSSYLTVPSTDMVWGLNDFTYETWIKYTSGITSPARFMFDQRSADATVSPSVYTFSANIYYFTGNSNRVTYAWTMDTASWYHFAICRSNGVTKMFLNGTQVGSSYTDTNSYVQGATELVIGTVFSKNNYFLNAYIDDFRVSSMARYTANFTPPTAEFTNDQYTRLLLKGNASPIVDSV